VPCRFLASICQNLRLLPNSGYSSPPMASSPQIKVTQGPDPLRFAGPAWAMNVAWRLPAQSRGQDLLVRH